MTRRAPRVLYALLFPWMLVSMGYYLAGVAALNEKWFHGDRHGDFPFSLHDDLTLHDLDSAAREAGLREMCLKR